MADISRRIKSPRRERGDLLTKTAAFTLKDSDSGSIVKWNSAVSFNYTLPPINKASKGVFFDFVIDTAATSGVGHGVDPRAADKVFVPGATAAVNKDAYFATASDAVGNGFRLTSNGSTGWNVTLINGTVAAEA